ncbi:response regulator [Rickettsiales bacterium]|nr:response regulator [Rickettsiales bacterium]
MTHNNIRNKSILIVDDEIYNITRTVKFLEELTNNIDSASNGQNAITQCQNNYYDLILMDLMMPIIDGFGAAKIIRNGEEFENQKIINHYQNIPIIAHTSCGESARNEAIKAGMNDLITKPSTKEVLLERVDYWLQRNRI